MIVFRTPKGWTCPKEIDGRRTEGYWRAHQVPMGEMHENLAHVHILEEWMKSYRPTEFFDDNGRLLSEIAELSPKGNRRMTGGSAPEPRSVWLAHGRECRRTQRNNDPLR